MISIEAKPDDLIMIRWITGPGTGNLEEYKKGDADIIACATKLCDHLCAFNDRNNPNVTNALLELACLVSRQLAKG